MSTIYNTISYYSSGGGFFYRAKGGVSWSTEGRSTARKFKDLRFATLDPFFYTNRAYTSLPCVLFQRVPGGSLLAETCVVGAIAGKGWRVTFPVPGVVFHMQCQRP